MVSSKKRGKGELRFLEENLWIALVALLNGFQYAKKLLDHFQVILPQDIYTAELGGLRIAFPFRYSKDIHSLEAPCEEEFFFYAPETLELSII